jgi:hypothetical protein
MICDQCETVKHCTKYGCVPMQPAPVQWWPKTEDQPIDNGPDYEDGPDEEGFSGPRPWNGFAQPAPTVQETVAYLFTNVQSGDIEASTNPDHKEGEREMWYREPLVRPPATQRQLTDVKSWVGLTDEEIYDCDEANACRVALAYAIEAKLKERNNG